MILSFNIVNVCKIIPTSNCYIYFSRQRQQAITIVTDAKKIITPAMMSANTIFDKPHFSHLPLTQHPLPQSSSLSQGIPSQSLQAPRRRGGWGGYSPPSFWAKVYKLTKLKAKVVNILKIC